jgi:hypothetical protein
MPLFHARQEPYIWKNDQLGLGYSSLLNYLVHSILRKRMAATPNF